MLGGTSCLSTPVSERIGLPNDLKTKFGQIQYPGAEEFIPKREARISIFDYALMFGDMG